MEEKDPRFAPIKDQDGFAVVPDRWKIDFFTSMGELSRFFMELKDNGRLMGTRCPKCGSVYCYPRSWCHECYVDCDWVEMSGKGKVVMFARVEINLSDIQTAQVPFVQGSVQLDEARYPIVNFFRNVSYENLSKGMPVKVEFLPAEERTGRIRDFYFVPDE
jgi:hypothetical protein